MYTANDLTRIRDENNLTQAEFADLLGITRELLNKMESGKRSISKSTAILLDKYLSEKNSEKSHTNAPQAAFQGKYIELLEKNLKDQEARIASLLEINKTLREDVQSNLKRVVNILVNHEAAMEARQQVVLEVLSTPDRPLEALLDSVYNIEGRLIADANQMDTFLQTGIRGKTV